ncbi:phosphorylase family protein [Merismopedia glauca]|uniref:Uncharacterized protein n=1 Tax=Merismopedia glauca CCAP 1448/3 TaxID=1296344 RepID=A0A2T1C0D1_9CYAN|nr:5'-methylthioadenosine/S-adenosylhomocysteine nucleosidase [Merismopedia glauca]PSB01627.1 hypothetical protein C7B64_17265 [Merismopedia glauca CCAP 1448/3]
MSSLRAVLSELIQQALTKDEFADLVFTHFPTVNSQFTEGQFQSQRIRLLLEYIDTRREPEKLLALIKSLNPTVYAEFAPKIAKAKSSPSQADQTAINQSSTQPAISSMSQSSQKTPTVGIITALPKEFAAMRRLLDNQEEIHIPGVGAGRRYVRGEVSGRNGGKHDVMLCLAAMGNNNAAIRSSLLLEHFPEIKSIVMVGIAGGIPHPEKPEDHVRLGDIVISNEKGVIQYDFDKETIAETIHRHPPRPPSASLLEGVRLLEADELEGKKPWLEFINQAILPAGETRPSSETDILVSSTDPSLKIEHPVDIRRIKDEPRVFTGSIASANKLLKNPLKRDELRDKFGVKAVEMEASGIADATWTHEVGYLVVRGICDYCDANKGDNWQAYAAAVAAAYTKALLRSMPAPKSSFSPKMTNPEELNAILDRLVQHEQTDADLTVLRQWLSGGGQIASQLGKYNVNLGQGQDIHVGDRIYQGVDAQTIREIVQSILQDLQAPPPGLPNPNAPKPPVTDNKLSLAQRLEKERLEKDLAARQQDYEGITDKLRWETNPIEKNSLEAQQEQLISKIKQLEQNLNLFN